MQERLIDTFFFKNVYTNGVQSDKRNKGGSDGADDDADDEADGGGFGGRMVKVGMQEG